MTQARLAALLMAALVAWFAPARVNAQMFPEDTARPLIDRAIVESFAESIREDRGAVVTALFDDYADHVDVAWKEYQEATTAASEALRAYLAANPGETNQSAQAKRDFGFQAALQAQRRRAQSLLDEFARDVRLVVADDSGAASPWDAIVKADWRRRMFRMINPTAAELGVTNLLDALATMEFSDEERAALAPVIEEYGTSLDAIFEPLDAGWMEVDDRLHAARRRLAVGDAAAIEQHAEAVGWYRAFNERIVELNGRFRSQFGAAMTPANRQGWQVTMQAASYQPLFQKSPVDAIIEGMRDTEELPADLKTSVELLYDQYVASRDALRVRATDVLQEYVRSGGLSAADAEFARLGEAARKGDRTARPETAWASNPVAPVLERLLEVEQQATRSLRSALGPDTIKSLPPHLRWLLAWDVGLDAID